MDLSEKILSKAKSYYNHLWKTVPCDSNIYGYVDGTDVYTHQYACHARLADNGCTRDAIWISMIYRSDITESVSFKEQASYFEWLLSSYHPWHEVLDKLDIEVIRNEDGLPVILVVKSLNVNRYALFSYLKAFRQIFERQDAVKLFTDTLKSYAPDSKEVLAAFFAFQSFMGKGNLYITLGHDHHCFRGAGPRNAWKRSIQIDMEDDPYHPTRSSMPESYYSGADLNEEVWGETSGCTAVLWKSKIEGAMSSAASYGHIFKNPVVKTGGNNSRPLKDVVAHLPRLIEVILEHYEGSGKEKKKGKS